MPDSPSSPLTATTTSRNGEISCSVAETNRIRLSLGLKPLRHPTAPPTTTTTTTAAALPRPPSLSPSPLPDALAGRVARARAQRAGAADVVAARSLAEEALLEGGDSDGDDEGGGENAELARWVERSRARAVRRGGGRGGKRARGGRAEEEGEEEGEKGKEKEKEGEGEDVGKGERDGGSGGVILSEEAAAAVEGKGVGGEGVGEVLVLADVDVVGEAEEGVALDVVAGDGRRRKRKEREKEELELNGARYDGTDAGEWKKGVAEGGVSVAGGARKVESDYYKGAGAVEAAFKKLKRSKRGPTKRRRVKEEKEEDKSEREKGMEEKSAVKGRMQELRRAAGGGGESSDEDVFYTSLMEARRAAKERETKGSVRAILEAIEGAEEGDDEAERIVYDEMQQFLSRIPVGGSSDDDSEEAESGDREKVREDGMEVDAGAGTGPDGENVGDLKVGDARTGPVPQTQQAQQGNEQRGPEGAQPLRGAPSAEIDKTDAPTAVDASAQPGQLVGVAAVLQRLRAKGELSLKPEQRGRARDKRFQEGDGGGDATRREIKLSHLDEFGNELTRKEAFRALCHKFHGKGPGQNKREKRLRQMLEAARVRAMRSDDTPLATAAALKEETRRAGRAHVVLSGPQAFVGGGVGGSRSVGTGTGAGAGAGAGRGGGGGGGKGGGGRENGSGPGVKEEGVAKGKAEVAQVAEEKVTFTLEMPGSVAGRKRRR